MAKKQHYMTYDERCKLEAFLRAGKSVTWIARELSFSERTIYYEKKRGEVHLVRNPRGIPTDTIEYSASKAQQIHDYNQTAKGRPLKIGTDHAYANYLERKILEDHFSPAAALASAKANGFTTSICLVTLYSYIDKEVFLHLTNKNLWEKNKKKKRKYNQVRRIVHPMFPNISSRPELINQRSEYGHWEMDLIIGKAKTKACLMTLTERLTRQEIIIKLPNRKQETIIEVFDKMEKQDPHFRNKFKSITTDNGPEFLNYDYLRRSIHGGHRFQIWYCHSYAAWEKGTNERNNRIIRRFFPKGTDFTKITKKQVAAVQDWMNNYPRKILDWKTPMEMIA
jgi:IS30 family transposase